MQGRSQKHTIVNSVVSAGAIQPLDIGIRVMVLIHEFGVYINCIRHSGNNGKWSNKLVFSTGC